MILFTSQPLLKDPRSLLLRSTEWCVGLKYLKNFGVKRKGLREGTVDEVERGRKRVVGSRGLEAQQGSGGRGSESKE